MKRLFLFSAIGAAVISLSGCGSFGEGMLYALAGNAYGYSTPYYNMGGQSSTTNMNYLLNPNYAAAQVTNQYQQEYNEFCKYNKKPDGTLYTYNEWLNMRGQATSTRTSSNSGGGSTTTTTTTTYKKDCHICHGLKKCWTCNGKHYYINPLSGKYVTCPNCGPDGKCRTCGGTGKK